MFKKRYLLTVSLLMSLLAISEQSQARAVEVRIDRWLEIQQPRGQVTFLRGTTTKQAKSGDRLQIVGDGVTTGQNSTAALLVDTGVGSIQVSPSTSLRVAGLQLAPDNGRITRLEVSSGQVRLQLRRFTHKGSRLEIRTPAGITGVRGTEFGLVVHPNGKTGVAARSGAVETTGRGRSVVVRGGFQNFTMPGETPSTPVPLRDDPSLVARFEQTIDERGVRRARLIGQTDPVNQVKVGHSIIASDRQGRFTAVFPLPSRLTVQVVVTTPLGKQQIHELAYP